MFKLTRHRCRLVRYLVVLDRISCFLTVPCAVLLIFGGLFDSTEHRTGGRRQAHSVLHTSHITSTQVLGAFSREEIGVSTR